MKRFKYHFHAAVCLLVACVVSGAHLFYKTVCRIDSCSVVTDGYLSPVLHASIKQATHDLLHAQIVDADTLSSHLIQMFPAIKKIGISRIPPHHIHVDVISHVPHYRINDDQVLVEDGHIISQDQFYPQQLTTLCTVQVAVSSTKKVPSECTACLTALSTDLLSSYSFFWQDAAHAWLYDKADAHFAILFHSRSVPDAAVLAQCNQIKQNLAERDLLNKKKNLLRVADVRFKDQIVMSTRKRG